MFELPELEYFRVPLSPLTPIFASGSSAAIRRNADAQDVQPAARRATDNIHYAESLGRYGFEVSISNKALVNIAVSPSCASSAMCSTQRGGTHPALELCPQGLRSCPCGLCLLRWTGCPGDSPDRYGQDLHDPAHGGQLCLLLPLR